MEEVPECNEDPNIMFALQNADYGVTGTEYRMTFKCSPGATGYSGAFMIAASMFSVLTAVIML